MAETKPNRIRTILDFLIDNQFLRTEGDEYPVVSLGSGFEKVLQEEQRLYLKLPKERKKRPQIEKPKIITTESAPNQMFADTAADFEYINKTLFDKLRELRREIAARERVPPYIVFSDASLRDMCRKKPHSLIQFSAVNGVGTVKLQKYGEAFVQAIRTLPDS
jgi:ATP-dependent DNA helicase RecQ